MTLSIRLTIAQQKQIVAVQKKYDAAVARDQKEGREFDPLNYAPTPGKDFEKDPVQQAIHKIWFNKKTGHTLPC